MSLNGEKFLDRMSDVDHRLITEADKARKSKGIFWKAGIVTVAAAAAVAVGLNFLLPMLQNKPMPQDNDPNWTPLSSDELPDLPMLEAATFGEKPVGMGYEGFSRSEMEKRIAVYDKLRQNFGIREMPVYKSGSVNPDVDAMRARLREVVEYFGLDYDSLDINETVTDEESLREQFEAYGAPEEEIQRMLNISRMNSYISVYERDDEGYSLSSFSIDASLCVSAHLSHTYYDDKGVFETGGIELPSEYNFKDGASPEELEAAGRYILDKFSDLFGINNPVVVTDPEYDGYVEFYEKGATDAESIANQCIKHVGFSSTDDGKLGMIRIFEEYKHCEKIADYPIANLEQATELLRNGNYLTSAMYDLTGEEEIAFVELKYRSGIGYSCVMPFYRFLVKLPEEFEQEGEEHYGAYYVAAVRQEYLGELDRPMISFNGGLIK